MSCFGLAVAAKRVGSARGSQLLPNKGREMIPNRAKEHVSLSGYFRKDVRVERDHSEQ